MAKKSVESDRAEAKKGDKKDGKAEVTSTPVPPMASDPVVESNGVCGKCGKPLMVMRRKGGERYALCSATLSGDCDSRLIPLTSQTEKAITTATLPQAFAVKNVVAKKVKGTPYYTETIYRIVGWVGLFRRVKLAAIKGDDCIAHRVRLKPGEAIAVTRWRDGELAIGNVLPTTESPSDGKDEAGEPADT